jgi:hypothetical protein
MTRSVASKSIDGRLNQSKIQPVSHPSNNLAVWFLAFSRKKISKSSVSNRSQFAHSTENREHKWHEGSHFNFLDSFLIVATLFPLMLAIDCIKAGVTVTLSVMSKNAR